MKVLKNDWCSKLSDDNVKALLRIKVKGLMMLWCSDSSDAAMLWWDTKEQGKGGNGKKKKYKKHSRMTKQLNFTNQVLDSSLEVKQPWWMWRQCYLVA